MAGELRLAEDFRARWIDGREGAAPESDVESFGAGVVAHVVGVVSELDGRHRPKIVGIQQLNALALAVRHRDEPCVGRNRDALRFVKAGQTLEMSIPFDVEHFDGVVAKRGDKEPPRRCVERQVIDAALDARQLNGAELIQRLLAGWRLHRDDERHCNRPGAQHADFLSPLCHGVGFGGCTLTFDPSRISSVPRRTIMSPSFNGPNTSIKSPTRAPRPTLTHCATPLFTRTTNIRSVVVTMLVGGTSSDGCGRLTGHCTSGYIPGLRRRSGFWTSSSTAIDRVFSSRSCDIRLITPKNVSPG